MKISIIVPVYRVEAYLNQCVSSVLEQSYQNFELILVDDGSPDLCPAMCDRIALSDNRVVVIHQENGGLSDARNKGIEIATGDYVLFLDSDDYWDDSMALKKLVDRIEKTRPDVLNYSYKKYYETDGTVINPFQNTKEMPAECTELTAQLQYLFENHLYIASACNKMVKTEILQKGALFCVGDTSEDVEWCAKLLVKSSSFDYIPENFYCYRQRKGSITHSIKRKNCEDLKKHITQCAAMGTQASDEVRPYLYQFASYQLAVFVATQSMAEEYPEDCVGELEDYTWLFQYKGSNKKEKAIAVLSSLIGYKNLCKTVGIIHKLRGKR